METAQLTGGGAKPARNTLYLQVLGCVAAGVILGVFRPDLAVACKPLGDLFIRLIKMVIAPLVFCTVAGGIAAMGDLRRAGRTGLKALVYFEVVSTLALVLGLVVAHAVKPGANLHVSAATLTTTELDKIAGFGKPKTAVDHVMDLVPESVAGAFVKGDMLQVLTVAILVGVAISAMRDRGKPAAAALHGAGEVLFAVVAIIMRAAPVGAFGAMAFTVGKYGIRTLASLGTLVATFYVTALLFVFVILGAICAVLRLSIFRLVAYLKDELLVVLGTSSSESVLPRLMEKMEGLGCEPAVVRLVVPMGYSFNLDGTSIYLTLATLFVSNALEVPLALRDELLLLGVLLLTSKGAAAVTGGGFITLGATLSTTRTVPVAGLSLLLGVDRFLSEARALTNTMGNAVATLVIARWEGGLDTARAKATLAKKR
ncbi:MAG: C4-dicarboxylate transporter DctA [Polyangiaceae bacterium]